MANKKTQKKKERMARLKLTTAQRCPKLSPDLSACARAVGHIGPCIFTRALDSAPAA